ncbi:MAG: hypothetical protein ABI678_27410, partial [Kofleriaceae bacterium]
HRLDALDITHDEDHDMLPDVLDPCPTNPDTAANVDTDQDGVGDLCDPAPNIGGDRKFLYTFESGLGDLVPYHTPTIETDSISFGNPANTMLDGVWTPISFTRVHIEVGYEIGAVGIGTGTTNYEELSVHLGNSGDHAGLDGLACSLERFDQSAMVHFYIENVPGAELMGMDEIYALTGTHGKLVVDNAGQLLCTSQRDGVGAVSVINNTGTIPGEVGVTAFQLRARITYLFVAGL